MKELTEEHSKYKNSPEKKEYFAEIWKIRSNHMGELPIRALKKFLLEKNFSEEEEKILTDILIFDKIIDSKDYKNYSENNEEVMDVDLFLEDSISYESDDELPDKETSDPIRGVRVLGISNKPTNYKKIINFLENKLLDFEYELFSLDEIFNYLRNIKDLLSGEDEDIIINFLLEWWETTLK